jgi:hypothetical protein
VCGLAITRFELRYRGDKDQEDGENIDLRVVRDACYGEYKKLKHFTYDDGETSLSDADIETIGLFSCKSAVLYVADRSYSSSPFNP